MFEQNYKILEKLVEEKGVIILWRSIACRTAPLIWNET